MRLSTFIILGTLLLPVRADADSVATASHVRPATDEVRRLIDAGMSTSSTCRRLVIELNGSDVIVYVQPKRRRKGLGAYLSHSVVSSGDCRDLRVALDITGPARSLVPVLAHELQHVGEVSRAREVRDAESIEYLFATLASKQDCADSNCFETAAAIEVEKLVKSEMSAAPRDQRFIARSAVQGASARRTN